VSSACVIIYHLFLYVAAAVDCGVMKNKMFIDQTPLINELKGKALVRG